MHGMSATNKLTVCYEQRTTMKADFLAGFCSLLLASATGFLLDPTTVSHCAAYHRHSKSIGIKSKNGNEIDQAEINEMEDLILSLSLEESDESRRERLQSIFDDELAKPNGGPKHFSDLFDRTLMVVGERVKAEAQEYAEKLQESAKEDSEGEEEKASETSQGFPQQKQLWAMIDMMVQSKTIVKRAEGTLGSKGTFQ